MRMPGRARETPVLSRRTSSTRRGSFSVVTASRQARDDGVTVARSTNRPSDLETILLVMTTTSPSSSGVDCAARAPSISATRSSPGWIMGRPATPTSVIVGGDTGTSSHVVAARRTSGVRDSYLLVAERLQHVLEHGAGIRLRPGGEPALAGRVADLLLGDLVQLRLLVRRLVEERPHSVHDAALLGEHVAALVVEVRLVEGGVWQSHLHGPPVARHLYRVAAQAREVDVGVDAADRHEQRALA